jgi:dGTPase
MTPMTSGYSEIDQQRLIDEGPAGSPRSPFARDRARVLHSAGLRRLAAKTQVMAAGELDFPRTRLTHTLEVAQIGRELGAALGCDPDLVDVAGLAHDLGHPPFGHNGESALHEASAAIGGFEGNAQTLRVLTRLEAKVLSPTGESAGLNLTRAALDATTKYPWPARDGIRKFGVYDDDLPVFNWVRDESVGERRCLEAQVMDWADDVAYSVHDLEDAVHGGHFDLRALADASEMESVIATARRYYARDLSDQTLREAIDRLAYLPFMPRTYDGSLHDLAALKEMTSRLISRFCVSVEAATVEAYPQGSLTRYSADVVIPDDVRAEVAVLKAVTAHYVMFREGAEHIYSEQRTLLTELVNALVLAGEPALETWLQPAFNNARKANDDAAMLRVIIDQVASLTDVSALEWHRRLCR